MSTRKVQRRTAVTVLAVLALAGLVLGVVLTLGSGPSGGTAASSRHPSPAGSADSDAGTAGSAGTAARDATAQAGGTAPGGRPGAGGSTQSAGTLPRGQRRSGTAGQYVPPASTLLATTHGSIPKFSFPGGPQSGQVPGTWHYARSVLPVIARRPGWLDVRLAQRPNESTAWVLADDVTLSRTPYAVVLDLATTHLDLYRDAHKIFSAPIGVGLPQYPTPTGSFFVAFVAAPPTPTYGAFVMVTSAHSNAITDWDMSGDAMTAIHGPLGSDAQIGTTGGRVSHGCIRMHENDLLHLRDVLVGSPVIIRSS